MPISIAFVVVRLPQFTWRWHVGHCFRRWLGLHVCPCCSRPCWALLSLPLSLLASALFFLKCFLLFASSWHDRCYPCHSNLFVLIWFLKVLRVAFVVARLPQLAWRRHAGRRSRYCLCFVCMPVLAVLVVVCTLLSLPLSLLASASALFSSACFLLRSWLRVCRSSLNGGMHVLVLVVRSLGFVSMPVLAVFLVVGSLLSLPLSLLASSLFFTTCLLLFASSWHDRCYPCCCHHPYSYGLMWFLKVLRMEVRDYAFAAACSTPECRSLFSSLSVLCLHACLCCLCFDKKNNATCNLACREGQNAPIEFVWSDEEKTFFFRSRQKNHDNDHIEDHDNDQDKKKYPRLCILTRFFTWHTWSLESHHISMSCLSCHSHLSLAKTIKLHLNLKQNHTHHNTSST